MDKELLAAEVQKYELLYDKSNKHYKNRVLVDQAWASVAQSLGIEDVESVRKTWKGMLDTRNQYRRKGKLPKSGSRATPKRPWSLASCLSWLDKYNQPPRTVTNVTEDDEATTAGSIAADTDSDADELASTENEPTTATTSTEPQQQYQRFKPQKSKKSKVDPVDAQLLELLNKESVPTPAPAQETDEDRGFFLSLWQDFKKLPANNKMAVKMQLMQVMYNASLQSSAQPVQVEMLQPQVPHLSQQAPQQMMSPQPLQLLSEVAAAVRPGTADDVVMLTPSPQDLSAMNLPSN